MTVQELKIAGDDLSTRDINRKIKEALNENIRRFSIESNAELDSIVVGIREEAEFILNGRFGDFVGALNHGPRIEIHGKTGRYDLQWNNSGPWRRRRRHRSAKQGWCDNHRR